MRAALGACRRHLRGRRACPSPTRSDASAFAEVHIVLVRPTIPPPFRPSEWALERVSGAGVSRRALRHWREHTVPARRLNMDLMNLRSPEIRHTRRSP